MNRTYNKIKTFAAILLITVFSAQMFTGCNDDDTSSGAVPEIDHIRLNDPMKSDSLLVSASLGQVIAIMGNNLADVRGIWFNDQEAILNTSYITNGTIVVTVPTGIPEAVTDSMTLVTSSGVTVQYPFKVQVPPPTVVSMKCEYVQAGEEAIINGNYFLETENKPLQVFFPGNVAAEVTDVQLKQIKVVVPEGTSSGPISVKTLYGRSTSGFHFRDDRNIFLDFDTKIADGGWRAGVYESEGGISDNYVKFTGDIPGDLSDWNEDAFSFNYWPTSTARTDDDDQILWNGDLADAVLKFEVNVTSEWSGNALQMIFTGPDVAATNSFIANGSPRGLWRPWETEGNYVTDGWITVSFNLTDFKYTHEGEISGTDFDKSFLSGLTLFVYNGGIEGTACSPTILIDNIRVVPK